MPKRTRTFNSIRYTGGKAWKLSDQKVDVTDLCWANVTKNDFFCRSGTVEFVLENGMRFAVNEGAKTSFCQEAVACVAANKRKVEHIEEVLHLGGQILFFAFVLLMPNCSAFIDAVKLSVALINENLVLFLLCHSGPVTKKLVISPMISQLSHL